MLAAVFCKCIVADRNLETTRIDSRVFTTSCHDCLQSCWSLAIREGTLSNVACPSFDCTKARVKRDQDRAENPTQQTPDAGDPTDYVGDDLLSKVVGDVLAERFKRLKEKKRVENDPTYTTCPMAHCQAPVGPPPRQRAKQDVAIKPANNVFRLSSGPVTRLDEKDLDKQRQTEIDRWDRFRQCEKCGFCFCRICEMGW
jgi:E3 ubiquitin-protein ligase RNF14